MSIGVREVVTKAAEDGSPCILNVCGQGLFPREKVYHHYAQSLVLKIAESTTSVCNHLINLSVDGTEIDVLDLCDILMISIYPSGLLALPRWNKTLGSHPNVNEYYS